jgi:hypothetical protein
MFAGKWPNAEIYEGIESVMTALVISHRWKPPMPPTGEANISLIWALSLSRGPYWEGHLGRFAQAFGCQVSGFMDWGMSRVIGQSPGMISRGAPAILTLILSSCFCFRLVPRGNRDAKNV